MTELEFIEVQEEIRNPKPKLWEMFPVLHKSFVDKWRGNYSVAAHVNNIFAIRQWEKDGEIEIQYCHSTLGKYTLQGDKYCMTGFVKRRLNDLFVNELNGYIINFVNEVKSLRS